MAAPRLETPPVTILVVEDDPDTRELWELIFRDEGFVVLVADSATAGLAMLRREARIDVVLTDYSLGDGTGEAMLRLALEAGAMRGTRALLCTAHHSVTSSPYARVVHKPLGADEAVAEVRSLLRPESAAET